MAAVTTKRILDEVGSPHLRLYRDKRASYFYFVFDDGRDYLDKSVFVAHLADQPLGWWVKDGRDLVAAAAIRRVRADAFNKGLAEART
jgi:hypothetical protein